MDTFKLTSAGIVDWVTFLCDFKFFNRIKYVNMLTIRIMYTQNRYQSIIFRILKQSYGLDHSKQ